MDDALTPLLLLIALVLVACLILPRVGATIEDLIDSL